MAQVLAQFHAAHSHAERLHLSKKFCWLLDTGDPDVLRWSAGSAVHAASEFAAIGLGKPGGTWSLERLKNFARARPTETADGIGLLVLGMQSLATIIDTVLGVQKGRGVKTLFDMLTDGAVLECRPADEHQPARPRRSPDAAGGEEKPNASAS